MTADPDPARFELAPAADPPHGRRLLGPSRLLTLDAHLEWYGTSPPGGRLPA